MDSKAAGDQTFEVHTSRMFDSKAKTFVTDRSIVINPATGLVVNVYKRSKELLTVSLPDIDLRGKTVIPGLVDAHTHLLLHSYGETPALNQMRDESFVERVVRATNHCRTALQAGYTTYRDLGTEGAYDADAHIRDCALASSGGYEIRQENAFGGTHTPRISDPCDGIVGCRAAVRRRLGAGADVVKFYADYRKRELRYPKTQWAGCPDIQFPPAGDLLTGQRNPNLLLFNQEEMDAMVSEARIGRAPVAAHASTAEGVAMASKAGVTTVEHGYEDFSGSDAIATLKKHGTIFVPTLAVVALYLDDNDMTRVLTQTKQAFDTGVKLACGGDTGAFPHGENAREIELFLEAGIPVEETLAAATLHGWEACGGEWCGRKFGWIGERWAADLVAFDKDLNAPTIKQGSLRGPNFVMKDGKVWKKDGKSV